MLRIVSRNNIIRYGFIILLLCQLFLLIQYLNDYYRALTVSLKMIKKNHVLISLFIIVFIFLCNYIDYFLFPKGDKPLSILLFSGVITSIIYLTNRTYILVTFFAMCSSVYLTESTYEFFPITVNRIVVPLIFAAFFSFSIFICDYFLKKFDALYAPLKSWKNSICLIFMFIIASGIRVSSYSLLNLLTSGNQSIDITYINHRTLFIFFNDAAASISIFIFIVSIVRKISCFNSIPKNEKRVILSLGSFLSILTFFSFYIYQNENIFIYLSLFMCIQIWTSSRLNQRCSYFILATMVFTSLYLNFSLYIDECAKQIYSQNIFKVPLFLVIFNIVIVMLFTFSYKIRQKEEASRKKLISKNMELIDSQLKLKTVIDSKSTFLASVSHEFKTPLNSLIGVIDLVKESKVDKIPINYVDILDTSSQDLLHLVHNLLDLARLEFSNIILKNDEFDLHKLLNKLVSEFTPRASKKDIGIEYIIDKNVPTYVIGDQQRIKQILLTIIDNSVKFTSHGHILFTINYDNHDEFIFSVLDTGKGISPFHMSRLLTPFDQINPFLNKDAEGLGLSLAIASKLVEQMEGKVEISSTLDMGTLCRVIIPIKRSTKILSKNQRTVSEQCTDFLKSRSEITVLIVDDSEDHRLIVKSILSNYNFKILEAHNGKVAVEIATDIKCDLIFMDMQMPVMNGFEATEKIRLFEASRYQDSVPIIALTAHVTEHEIGSVFECGCSQLMTKPFKKELLLLTICNHLGMQPV